ncbi:hypothetical protein [Geomicrobium sp. JCM 19038]|uniref:hypothetical protein n=1 Tax=Geomicrobium sp. JCM 19038 TaxID=1460635 RepID=UPI00045F2FF3|nr:hypothetical protein [Geomicrobium sp. JCM 19038]GAK10207.1 hypothetical protein JCM19038_4095 [Geomicrobium sp. JCM 19038]
MNAQKFVPTLSEEFEVELKRALTGEEVQFLQWLEQKRTIKEPAHHDDQFSNGSDKCEDISSQRFTTIIRKRR